MGCKLIQVIECMEARRGDGKDERSPVRVVTQYFTTDGVLLAEVDPCAETIPVEAEMHPRCSLAEHRRNQERIRMERFAAGPPSRDAMEDP